MSHATVQEHMSPEPVTIAPSASLAEASQTMRERAVRHLPVVSAGEVVGVLSERDINVARTLKSVTLDKAKVELVMSAPPLTVPPDARLSDVAARMIDRKAGSAVVVHEGRIVGIFTSHDALHALHRLLAVSG